ncbi:SxtJ family membrane protein [Solitalea koreensis]|uniref:SxtJ n=1 Tax=Solitalea koreensis TaxID=543615 RepID=A0A521CJ04_9SPHI|nr:SxtJ family membrane protein [Solitalea koreensis]SMO59426.1 hypothetical protein SAMN06265350_104118 [Solitalea koreensis]
MKKEQISESLLVLTTAMIAAGLIFNIHGFYTAALLMGLCGVFFLGSLGLWITKGWLKFSEVLGYINGRVLLTLIFFLVLTPVAYLKRLFKGSANFVYRKEMNSYYFVRNKMYQADDLENTW